MKTSSGFEFEMVTHGNGDLIKYLIVVVDRSDFDAAAILHHLKPRLDSTSTLLILQNRNLLATIDDVSANVFPDPKLRPALWVGRCLAKIEMHPRDSGVLRSISIYNDRDRHDPERHHFYVGPCCLNGDQDSSGKSGLGQVLQAKELRIEVLDLHEVHKRELLDIARMSVFQPLSVIFNCTYGELVRNRKISALIKTLIVKETGPILRALHPLGKGALGLSDTVIGKTIYGDARKRRMNYSQMWYEGQAGQTKQYHDFIDGLNGWLVKKGQELGLPTTYNETTIRLVKERRILQDAEISTVFPLATGLRLLKNFHQPIALGGLGLCTTSARELVRDDKQYQSAVKALCDHILVIQLFASRHQLSEQWICHGFRYHHYRRHFCIEVEFCKHSNMCY